MATSLEMDLVDIDIGSGPTVRKRSRLAAGRAQEMDRRALPRPLLSLPHSPTRKACVCAAAQRGVVPFLSCSYMSP